MIEKAIKLKTKITTCQYIDKITKEKSKPFKHFITDMIQGMLSTKSACLFRNCSSLTNINANNWDTSNVTEM